MTKESTTYSTSQRQMQAFYYALQHPGTPSSGPATTSTKLVTSQLSDSQYRSLLETVYGSEKNNSHRDS
uniref:Uncharacterized protein n=1 Tax=Megaselia scalaris TaxID=36166 RepID=T1GFL9_MEGSC